MEQSKLGELLTGTEQRDAVHVAIMPCTASERLSPGQHVGFPVVWDNKTAGSCENPIGIVDPFLAEPVEAGQLFWLVLYPGSTESLRHEWTHQAIAPAESRAFVAQFAEQVCMTYEEMMSAADALVLEGKYGCARSEYWRDIPEYEWEDFWRHYSVITGRKHYSKSGVFDHCGC